MDGRTGSGLYKYTTFTQRWNDSKMSWSYTICRNTAYTRKTYAGLSYFDKIISFLLSNQLYMRFSKNVHVANSLVNKLHIKNTEHTGIEPTPIFTHYVYYIFKITYLWWSAWSYLHRFFFLADKKKAMTANSQNDCPLICLAWGTWSVQTTLTNKKICINK